MKLASGGVYELLQECNLRWPPIYGRRHSVIIEPNGTIVLCIADGGSRYHGIGWQEFRLGATSMEREVGDILLDIEKCISK
jgi:hypothetical protein